MTQMEATVRHWFEHYVLNPFGPVQQHFSRSWIDDKAHSQPEFADSLRVVALEALDRVDANRARRALRALAIVGRMQDLARIEELLSEGDNPISADAWATISEIKRRAV